MCKLLPSDKDAREKYEFVVKEHKFREFSKCIGYDEKDVSINLESITVESSYTGPRLEGGV